MTWEFVWFFESFLFSVFGSTAFLVGIAVAIAVLVWWSYKVAIPFIHDFGVYVLDHDNFPVEMTFNKSITKFSFKSLFMVLLMIVMFTMAQYSPKRTIVHNGDHEDRKRIEQITELPDDFEMKDYGYKAGDLIERLENQREEAKRDTSLDE